MLPPPVRPVLVAIAGVALVLVLAEAATRSWLVSPLASLPDARYGWVFRPGVRVVQSSEGWAVSRTNSQGLLDDELRVPRPRLRAVLLGDSFTEALNVPHEARFGTVAERLVPGLEVVTVGYSGRSPVQYADWLEQYGPALAPDVVVVQVSASDLLDLVTPAALARQAAVARAPAAPPPDAPTLRVGPVRRVLQASGLLTAFWQRMRLVVGDERAQLARRLGRGGPAPAASPRTTCADDPRQEALLDALHRRIAASAPRIVYLYLPSLDWFSPGWPEVDRPAADLYHRVAARHGAGWVDPSDALRAEFARTGAPPAGFANSVLGHGHLNAAGHRVVGGELARALAAGSP